MRRRNTDLSCAGVCVACGQAVRMRRVRLAWRALLVSAVRKRGQAGTVVCLTSTAEGVCGAVVRGRVSPGGREGVRRCCLLMSGRGERGGGRKGAVG